MMNGWVTPALGALTAAATLALSAGPGQAGCRVIGDSVAVGLSSAMEACSASAGVGISANAVARRAGPGGAGWLVVALGSNDFPRGISDAQRRLSTIHVRGALNQIHARAGSGMVVVVPANAARNVVAGWVQEAGVESVSYAPGRDGIHPRNYAELAGRIRTIIGD